MSRIDDLLRFYALLALLEEKTGGARVLSDCSGRMNWPQRGIYFFFEPGESRSDTGNGRRVVRVGTHALTDTSKTTLWTRLGQHRGTGKSGGGNHRGSIFRLLVGTALTGAQPALAAPSWDNDKSDDPNIQTKEAALEVRVSEIIRAMPFLWVSINDVPGAQSQRGLIERNAIALLSNYERTPLDPASPTWLGLHCNRPRVRASGLWNFRHVNEQHDPDFLDVFNTLIAEQVAS